QRSSFGRRLGLRYEPAPLAFSALRSLSRASGRFGDVQMMPVSVAMARKIFRSKIDPRPGRPSRLARHFERHTIRPHSIRTLTIRIKQEETIMLTRRGFAGLASCALCGLAEFVATEVSAQGTPPPAPIGFTRKMLSQMDGPMPGYVTIVAEVTIDPGTLVARHTHPGIESGYVVSGGIELPIEGQPTRMVKAG